MGLKSEKTIEMISKSALIIPKLGTNQNLSLNAPSAKRPALAIKSVTGQTQFLVPVANSSMKNKMLIVPKKNVLGYLKPMVKLAPTSTSSEIRSSSSVGQPLKSTTNAQTPHSTSILIRSNSKSPKVPQLKSFSTGRTVPKVTDKQTKDHFMLSLGKCQTNPIDLKLIKMLCQLFLRPKGLVTKETLNELQSRKCERKRRTTANPQFSSAALEAKRITKLELAERKAKRRLLITSSDTTTTTAPTAVNGMTAANSQRTTSCLNSKTTYLSSGSSPKSIGVEQQEIMPGI